MPREGHCLTFVVYSCLGIFSLDPIRQIQFGGHFIRLFKDANVINKNNKGRETILDERKLKRHDNQMLSESLIGSWILKKNSYKAHLGEQLEKLEYALILCKIMVSVLYFLDMMMKLCGRLSLFLGVKCHDV